MLDNYAPAKPSDYDPEVGILLCHLRGEAEVIDDAMSLIVECRNALEDSDVPASARAFLSGAAAILSDVWEGMNLRIRYAEEKQPATTNQAQSALVAN